MSDGLTTERRYCRCGDSMFVATDHDATASVIAAAWLQQHQGQGHGEVTAIQAANARRRQARAEAREREVGR
jgi:hypothetical protein